jgi:hypothetical protein
VRPQYAVPTTRETPGTRPAMTWTTRNAAATGVCGNVGDPARGIPAQLDVSPPLKTASVMADTPDDRPRSRMEADKIMLPDTKSTAPDEPVEITQTLTTISPQAVRLPSDLGLAGQHARVAVTRPDCAIAGCPALRPDRWVALRGGTRVQATSGKPASSGGPWGLHSNTQAGIP